MFEDRYQKLNAEQQRAVDTTEGPVLVVAGPGSGKTELLSMRVANILRTTDVHPSSILCLTFTDSAAVNMRKRLEKLIGKAAFHVAIHTFHSFGTEVIKEYPEYFYQGARMVPADDVVRYQIMEEILEALPLGSPLRSYHPEQGYTYLKSLLTRIGEVKKGGMMPKEWQGVIEENITFLQWCDPKIQDIFGARVSEKMKPQIAQLVEEIGKHIAEQNPQHWGHQSLGEMMMTTLAMALNEEGTKAITAWKNTYTKKDAKNSIHLKDFLLIEKHRDFGKVYEAYHEAMNAKGYFDFDDMLLDTVGALETHDDLRFTIQEKYLYLLVDEFQDTSGVQMRLLENLINMEVTDGAPNILAVGDDDQAIYKFQGANLTNMLGFHKKFADPTFITLTKNYRSTQDILDLARKVILGGTDRLEQHMPEIVKELVASNPTIAKGQVEEHLYETKEQELLSVVKEICRRKEENPKEEIAVLAPKHKHLVELMHLLEVKGVPVEYERTQNILEEPHIAVLLNMLAYGDSMLQYGKKAADELLPEILAFPFFGLRPATIWHISRKAHEERKLWIEVMENFEEEAVQHLAAFFIELAVRVKSDPVERVFDFLTGIEAERTGEAGSGYKNYYFSKEKFLTHPGTYFALLKSVEVLIGRVREHKGKEMLYAKDIIAFIDFHKRYSISIRNVVRTKEGEGSVVLMTAHKAKGLEFDTVFLLHVNDEVWVPKREGGGVSIAHPLNLPFSAEKNTEDDHLRLFYVALTRAKSSLYLTNHQFNEKGKETPVLRFQSGENQKSIAMEEASSDAVTEEWYNLHSAEKTTEEHTLLASLVENYQMSVTHFNTFLNVAKGGPEYFMTHNLLRFPEAKSVTSTFGTCIHAALQRWYVEYKQTKTPPSAEKLQEFFLERIKEERLTEKEKKEYGEKGATCLARYFEGALQTADPEDIPEADFTHQGVLIEEAHLTGKIDRLHLDKEEKKAVVTDFKTGAVLHKWTPSEDYAKQKVWGYKNQLLFYKLLVEGSRTYNTYTVDEGILAFVEGKEKEEMELRLRMEREEVEQLKKLIGIVYKKITTLDFPDVSKYEKNMKGIEAFVKDLLEGKV